LKNSAYYRLKHQLADAKNRRKKQLIWKLTPEQVEFVRSLGYRVEEFLYQVKTKPLSNIHFVKSKLLKDIHYANKRGVSLSTFALDENKKKILDEHGIKYRPYKYKIFLNPSTDDEASY